MKDICRTCLRIVNKSVPLYGDATLVNKIETISSVEVITSDEFPSNICVECVGNVNRLYNFRKVIINSDKELKERKATLERTKNRQGNNNESNNPSERLPHGHDVVLKSEEPACETATSPAGFESGTDAETDVPVTRIRETIKMTIANMKRCRCNVCDKTFPSRIKLHNHKRTEHVAPGICNICGMVVRSDNLKRHVQMHSAGTAECEHCGKVVKNSESLRGHMLIHRGVVFTCEICGKHSKVKAEHRRHMKTHVDPEIGKVMCSICGKLVRDIRKHLHSHTGERPHPCEFCHKGFTSSYSLKVHTRQHTNEKPYPCQFCSMAFPQKVSLMTHLRSKHNCMKLDIK